MRFFSFGCSFTRGTWPTWADIVARQYSEFQNWGKGGAGNAFIFYSLMECIKRNNITADDTVMIMWSSIGREDRYVAGNWLTPGSIYNQTNYDENFVNKFTDPTGYLLRDMAHVSATKQILDNIGCNYKFFSIVPLNVPDDNIFKIFSIDNKITNLYQEEIKSIRPSVYETIFNHNWYSRVGYRSNTKLQEEYLIKRGDSWPTWEKFVEQDFTGIPTDIVEEINETHELSNKLLYRYDTHPIPSEYLEYLNLVAPEIKFDQATCDWVDTVTQLVLEEKPTTAYWKQTSKPARF